MHEMRIVTYVADEVLKLAKENKLTHIESVTLEAGEVSMIVPRYLEECWTWLSKKYEILDGAKLIFESIKAINHCNDCGYDYGTLQYGRVCPRCKSDNTVLKNGSELYIKEIEAY